MNNLIGKALTFLTQGKNKALVDALVRENDKLKLKLNSYVNYYLKEKEKWKLTLDILQAPCMENSIEQFFDEIVKNVVRCTNNENVYLVIYSDNGKNQIHTTAPKRDLNLHKRRYFEGMRYEDIKSKMNEISGPNYKILKIQGMKKEYGYLFLELEPDYKIEGDECFIKMLCRYVFISLLRKEGADSYQCDNKKKVEFLVNFSHELKTPLNGIITYSEFLKAEKNQFSPDVKKYIENINIAARQLNYLMIDIVESAKTEYSQLKIVREKFQTNVEILNILSVFHSKIIEKNLRVERVLTEVEICSDIAKFNQILYNLISNAIKFSPPNGNVKLYSWVEDGNFRFEIEDEGCGINERDRDKIFKFLSQASESAQKEGSGIGLAISKKIVEIQGGKIGYESKETGGTIFWFYLPLDGWF